MRHHALSTVCLLSLTLLALASPAVAEPRPSSDLLLPFFEVDLSGPGRTTLFAVANSADEPLELRAAVHSNWGVEIVASRIELDAGEVVTVNLRDWLVDGALPHRLIGPDELAHVQAALSGQTSPRDDLYYGTEVLVGRAVGYVTLRVLSTPRHDALWGDYFWVDPGQDFAEGELLVDIDRSSKCPGLCDHHLLRFLEGGGFDGGTKLIVWSPKRRTPSPTPLAAGAIGVSNVVSISDFHRESGERFDQRDLDLLPVELLDVRDLFLDEEFGWLDVSTGEDVYIGVRYTSETRYSVALQTWCLDAPPPPPPPPQSKEPEIRIEKSTNGEDADDPPGPRIEVGDPVNWEYLVTNTGELSLTDVLVTDDREGTVPCPKAALAVGESMTCTLSGIAADLGSTTYRNLGTVIARDPDGKVVRDDDPSHHSNPPAIVEPPLIEVEKATNGEDADSPTGPKILVGDRVAWTYVIRNPSPTVTLIKIALTDDKLGPVPCPKATLAPGESMTCRANGTAVLGQYANLATVRGESSGGIEVTDTDPSHYLGVDEPPPPEIDLEKATNGEDADTPTGPLVLVGDPVTWTYVVRNTGGVRLTGVAVTDDRIGAIACPKSALVPGEAMTCTARGTATLGQYSNLGTVRGTAPDGRVVNDRDPSHYKGVEGPAIDLEKATNGHDADTPTGPVLAVGAAVEWTFVVKNTGNVRLTGVSVRDDKLGAISCPKSALAVGESMTCRASGKAQAGQYKNEGWAEGKSPSGKTVEDHDPSHYLGEEPCGPCEGKVTRLTVRYLGGSSARVRVEGKRGPSDDVLFDEIVAPGGTFELVGPPHPNGGFDGTLGTEIDYFVDGIFDANMHTSCSQPIGPGLRRGSFEVIRGESKSGGPLCPL